MKKVEAKTPPIAHVAHVGGTVVLAASVDQDGKPSCIAVLSGPPLLSGAAIDAAQQWRFSPFLVDGAPGQVRVTLEVQFPLLR